MSIRFGRGSTRRGWSTHEKHARHRAHDPAFLRLGPGVGGYRAYLRGADLHLPGSLESRRSALERIRERALSEAPLPHAARDAARILVGLGARVFSGRGRGLEPLRRVFLLSVHRDVPIASQSGAGAFDRGLVRPRAQIPGRQRSARRLLPAARQHDGRAQVGRRGPGESDALARRQR